MEEISSKIRNKKRLMFISGEDFYLMAYSIVIILDELGCFEGKKTFKDHRKFAFLISVMGDSRFKSIWVKLGIRNSSEKSILSIDERKIMLDAYYWAIGKDPTIERLLINMEKNGILALTSDSSKKVFDVSLREHEGVKKILDCDLYDYDRDVFRALASVVKRMNVLTLESFVEKTFHKFEIGKCLV
ncbi:hypothetical protein [Halobacteriovorax sp. JY17]|uniref:hypothetical protein n=1 Tax=Halobacteriovorax sp. JY17 TaxID=2014617 RepID=UPI000C3FC361|nr:hypothetical protein [Halobacteriovorax sp. JY17]PIK13532.1 MAG: hypothetical protein CES88_16565 [Halobacteriovorax sp. JY17]